MKHLHQFFETNKEIHNTTPLKGKPQGLLNVGYISIPDKYGVRVVCAICGEKRMVWQTGEIDVWDNKKKEWKEIKL